MTNASHHWLFRRAERCRPSPSNDHAARNAAACDSASTARFVIRATAAPCGGCSAATNRVVIASGFYSNNAVTVPWCGKSRSEKPYDWSEGDWRCRTCPSHTDRRYWTHRDIGGGVRRPHDSATVAAGSGCGSTSFSSTSGAPIRSGTTPRMVARCRPSRWTTSFPAPPAGVTTRPTFRHCASPATPARRHCTTVGSAGRRRRCQRDSQLPCTTHVVGCPAGRNRAGARIRAVVTRRRCAANPVHRSARTRHYVGACGVIADASANATQYGASHPSMAGRGGSSPGAHRRRA